MKKTIFMLLLVINVGLINGQCSCCGSSSNISAGETTPMSYSLDKGQFLAELYSDLRLFDPVAPDNSPDHHSQTNMALSINNMVLASVGLRYGINSRLSLSVQQPYIFINGVTTNSKTFGDLLSLANYILIRKQKMALNFQAGMEWPTGENVQEANGNSVATGSGSFDPVAGFGFVRMFERSSLRAGAFFKYTTDGFNNINYGKFCNQQISYNYFVTRVAEGCTPDSASKKLSFAVNAQLSGEWLQMQMKNYSIIANTGGYTVLAGLGATLNFKGFSVPLVIAIPVCQYMHGNQNQNRFRLRVGLTKTF